MIAHPVTLCNSVSGVFKGRALIIAALLVLAAPSCSEPVSCKTAGNWALVVTVLDGAGARLCNAKVIAVDGRYSVTLDKTGFDAECVYGGPVERAGTYEVRVMAGRSSRVTRGVVVHRGACNVETRELVVKVN